MSSAARADRLRLRAGQPPAPLKAPATKAERRGRVYIDYRRSSPAAKAAAASAWARPVPGLPASPGQGG